MENKWLNCIAEWIYDKTFDDCELMNVVQFYRWMVIINGAVPGAMLAWDAASGSLGANPTSSALHITGMLSLIFLALSLAITPLRKLSGWGGWIAQRRALGLYAFFYGLVHVAIYTTLDRQLSISSLLSELGLRRFLQVGAVAFLLMVPLAITSTNAMQRRLGAKHWRQLHRLAYPIALLAVVHFGLSVKSDMRLPATFAVIVVALLATRLKTRTA